MNRNEAFRERLQRALIQSRYDSQRALAEELQMREATISAWLREADPVVPSGDVLLRLPGLLDVSGHWLLTGEGSMEVGPPDQAAVRLKVIGLVREGDYVGAIEDLGDALTHLAAREDVADVVESFVVAFRQLHANAR